MVKPSLSSCLRKSAAALRSFLVSVGRSKNTRSHMMRYSLKRSIGLQLGVGDAASFASEAAR